MDLNRYAIAIQYKLVGNSEKAETLINGINLKSLNKKQRFLLSQPTVILKTLFKLKHILKHLGIHLSSFR